MMKYLLYHLYLYANYRQNEEVLLTYPLHMVNHVTDLGMTIKGLKEKYLFLQNIFRDPKCNYLIFSLLQ